MRHSGAVLRRAGRWTLLFSIATTACGFGKKTRTESPPEGGAQSAETRCGKDCLLEAEPWALSTLLAFEDTDSDRRITVRDEGPRHFRLPLSSGEFHDVEGTYPLANLVQELFLAHEEGKTQISAAHIDEPIGDRLSRLIRDRYWTNLTRRIDPDGLEAVLSDSKMDGQRSIETTDWPSGCTKAPDVLPRFLYVPHDDDEAFDYYEALVPSHPSLVVCRLPRVITPQWVNSLSRNEKHGSRHGLLSLAMRRGDGKPEPLPYGVPGGRFNEMYGWDSYFHVRGLLRDGRVDLARALVDNQLYEVRHYGKVLNANRTYYLTRTQPPFLSSAVRALHQKAPQDPAWLKAALKALVREYQNVWNSEDRITPLCEPLQRTNPDQNGDERVCLATYHAAGLGEPPEVEPGHFDWLYHRQAQRRGVSAEAYRALYLARDLPQEDLAELDWFFMHDRSMRESGHDTTYRWSTNEGDRCADFATIDLNALLFKYELDLASLFEKSGAKEWEYWCKRAAARRKLVHEYLFDGTLFVDYHLERDAARRFTGEGQKSTYVSATTLYPLWASIQSPCTTETGRSLSLLTDEEQTQKLTRHALGLLESPGGLAATARSSVRNKERPTARQWDFPFGWAPHQILAWEGLRRHGFEKDADRLTYRWLYMIAKNAHDYHGTVPEKYDVVRRSHDVFAEYGNVGTEFSYITREGFGWMNASFQLGWSALDERRRTQLNQLVPPERLDDVP